ncbi:MAG: hypothetical protein ACQES1_10450 [Bacteroidota bacterium]
MSRVEKVKITKFPTKPQRHQASQSASIQIITLCDFPVCGQGKNNFDIFYLAFDIYHLIIGSIKTKRAGKLRIGTKM